MFKKKHIKVGVSPINWSNDDLPELGGDIPFDKCISEMAQAGYEGCEIGHKFIRDPNELHEHLKPLNLNIASGWFSSKFTEHNKFNETVENFVEHIKFLKSMNSNVVVVAECGYCLQHEDISLFYRPIFTKKQWQQLYYGLESLGEIASSYNMNVVIHPHVGTGIFNAKDIENIFANVSSNAVSLLLDTGHLYLAGENIVKTISHYGDKIKHVHLKDIRENIFSLANIETVSFLEAVKKGIFTVPGDGCINFPEIFSALEAVNYRGWWIVEAEQDPKKAPPLEYAVKGRKYIHNLVGV